jgi:hypothetical protein
LLETDGYRFSVSGGELIIQANSGVVTMLDLPGDARAARLAEQRDAS